MSYTADTHRGETDGHQRDTGPIDQTCNSLELAVDGDEAGNPIYCTAKISEFLQRDCL